MSLINDALRKARQAAAEHDEQRPGRPFQAPRAYPSRAPRRGTGMAAVVLIASIAAVGGAALVWWALDRADQPVIAGAEQSIGAPQQPATDPVPAPMPEGTAQETPAAPTDPPEQSGEPLVSPHTEDVEPVQIPPSPTSIPTRAKEIVVRNEEGERERVYILDAKVGNVTLSLGYIVARTTNPFAEINGIEVLVGSEIEGFVVEKIEPDRVVLRDKNGLLVLRVP